MKEKLIDSPITDYSEDLLNRKIFVDTLASSLQNWDKEESLVIGLYGKWGSGKSSVINLVEKRLSEEKNKLSKKEQKKAPIVVKFNPWGYSESEDLFDPFIMQLNKTLKGPDKIQNLSNKLEALLSQTKSIPSKQDWLSFFSSLTMLLSFAGISIPLVFTNFPKIIQSVSIWLSPIVLVISIILQILSLVFSIIKFFKNKQSLSDIKKDIGKILSKKKRKIIIIIDDIDRLSSKEIKQLFRIVRYNADFPNTIYLLSFDREIVEKSLDIQNQINGHDYLEKIINIEYNLPEASKFEIENFLFQELTKIVENFGDEGKNFFYQQNIKWNSLKVYYPQFLTTIRDVKRYINSLNFKLSQYTRNEHLEINLIDYFTIELIRLKFPNSYNLIMHNKNVFIVTKKDFDACKYNKKQQYEEFLSQYSDSYEKRLVSQILPLLFPIIEQAEVYVTSTLKENHFLNEEKYCSICTNKYFDIYFNGTPEISKRDVLHSDYLLIQENINNYKNLITIFRNFSDENKFKSFVSNLTRSGFYDAFCTSYNCIFFSALFDILEEIQREFTFSLSEVEEEIYFMFYRTCVLHDVNNVFDCLQKIITSSKSLYMPIKIVVSFPYSTRANQFSFSKDQIESLNELIIEKIKQNQDTLIHNPYFVEIIRFWKNSDEQSYKDYFNNSIKDNSFFISFISHFVNEVPLSIDFNSSKQYAPDIHKMKEFYSPSEAINRIETIKKVTEELYKKYEVKIDIFTETYYKQFLY